MISRHKHERDIIRTIVHTICLANRAALVLQKGDGGFACKAPPPR